MTAIEAGEATIPSSPRAARRLAHILLDRLFERMRRFVDPVATYSPQWQRVPRNLSSARRMRYSPTW